MKHRRSVRTRGARGGAVWLALAGMLALILVFELGVLRPVQVLTLNMAPTLEMHDRIMIRGWGATAGHGDVIVYRSPFEGQLRLGRVVAMGGESVALDESGLEVGGRRVAAPFETVSGDGSCEVAEASCSLAMTASNSLVQAEELAGHRYTTRSAAVLASRHFPPRIVAEGHLFVLNDNRIDDRDSRIYGAIPLAAVVGVASFVYYAFDETGVRWDRMSRPVS